METALVNHQQPQFTSPTYSFDNTTMDSANSPPQYLKMEDLQSGSSPSPTSFDNCGTSTQASPPPLIVTSKPAKKRKSWGQELPEPKTTLPPRKRAKTDDEKEQRRIERIKRNRAAAHNSRERKRQEAENLAVLLAVAEAKLEAYAKLHGPLPANTVLREVQVRNDGYDESTQAATRASNNRADTPHSDYSTPAPSLSYSRGSIDAAASPASPADTVISNYPTIKIEPSDLPTTISPPAFEALDPKSGSLSHLDATQHSAAMLCDLQCPSSQRRSRMSTHTPTFSNPSSTSAATSQTTWTTWMASLFTTLLAFQLRTCYQQILLAIWTLSPTRMERMIRASTTRLAAATRFRSMTLSTMMPSLSRSTTPLAQLNAATGVATRDEGAHTALTRSSSATDSRAKSGSADGAKNRSSVCAALKRDGGSHGKHQQGQNDDGVGH
jgi:transcriptional activator HAC1